MFKTLQEARRRLSMEYPDLTVLVSQECWANYHPNDKTLESRTEFRASVHTPGRVESAKADTPDRAVSDLIDRVSGGEGDYIMQGMVAEVKAVSDERNAEA
jgi:hypothetical protein